MRTVGSTPSHVVTSEPSTDPLQPSRATTTEPSSTLGKEPAKPDGYVPPNPTDPRPRSTTTPQPTVARPLSSLSGPDPARTSISVARIKALEQGVARPITVEELAGLFPNARIGGKGATLAELASKPLGPPNAEGARMTLGAATVDKNGDLDVTPLCAKELKQHNQNLIIAKGDEWPVPLSHTIAHGTLEVNEKSQRAALAGAGFSRGNAPPRIPMGDMAAVTKALTTLGFDPKDKAKVAQELKAQGVHITLSQDDALRRVLMGKLDAAQNVLDIDDKLVANPGGHNHEIQPTVHASAKISPSQPDDLVLIYKRFNNQSYAGQGNWLTKLLGKDKHPQHEFDAECMFLRLDVNSRELEQVMACRHYYGEFYNAKDVDAVKARTKRDDLTVSVSYLAHGAKLAEPQQARPWAGHGGDGVKWNDPRDHILRDKFMGFEDVQAGRAVLIPKERINLVLESDDAQTINLKTQFGETRKGLGGTRIMDIYNDGMPPEPWGGTEWMASREKLAKGEAWVDAEGKPVG